MHVCLHVSLVGRASGVSFFSDIVSMVIGCSSSSGRLVIVVSAVVTCLRVIFVLFFVCLLLLLLLSLLLVLLLQLLSCFLIAFFPVLLYLSSFSKCSCLGLGVYCGYKL